MKLVDITVQSCIIRKICAQIVEHNKSKNIIYIKMFEHLNREIII